MQLGRFPVGIRSAPEYPGERTGEVVPEGAVLDYISKQTFVYESSSGSINIMFYQLQDGRGWIHDYDPERSDGRRNLSEVKPKV